MFTIMLMFDINLDNSGCMKSMKTKKEPLAYHFFQIRGI